MIEIVIPPLVPGEDPLKRLDRFPTALLNVVHYLTEHYTERNDTEEKLFDRKFEELNPGAHVYYNPDRVVWDNESDYLVFTLKWS